MAYEYILVGSGEIYTAPVGTTFPNVDQIPADASADWTNLGEFDGGVQVSHPQTIDEHRHDLDTGPVKATRSSEGLTFTVSLAKHTLENLALVRNNDAVADTAAASGTKGFRVLQGYRGLTIVEFALIFEGSSPYLAGDLMRFLVPRGYFGGDLGSSYVKDNKTLIPVEFHALVDPDATSDNEKFGTVEAVGAAALP